MTSTADRARLIGFVAASGARRAASRITNTFAGGLPFDGRAPSRLLIAPHDLRVADPTIAADIYRGRFSLSGTAAEIGAVSPFAMEPPSPAWESELLGFSWLRHFHAADDAVSRIHARALIGDWIAVQGRGHAVGWQPPVLARRIISWLSHSPVYLSHAEPDFYRLVMRSLGRQLRYLARHVRTAPDGVPRLTAHIAMAYATLCVSGLERLQVRAMRLLAAELDRQILPDGGHISRHPGAILDLLLDLLPLRQTFLSRDIDPPQSLIGAIDRMMPMVRFFRHGDGSFALFNGMGRTQGGVVSAILAYDESRGRPPAVAPHTGYQRLEAGSSVVLIEAGPSPPAAVSHAAHAGCLSFEFSAGTQKIITNCGGGSALKESWRQAARTTAAHSTVVVGNTSSARFVTGDLLTGFFGTPIIGGPKEVVASRHDDDDDVVVECRHDGYRRLGIIHHRRIALSRDGLVIEGQDRLTRSSNLFSRNRAFSLRFHLHPQVAVSLAADSRSAVLTLPGTNIWRFAVFGASIRLDESVYLVDTKGARRTQQIVISGQCGNEAMVRWTLRRDGADRAPRLRQTREGEREEQILPLAVDLPVTNEFAEREPNEDEAVIVTPLDENGAIEVPAPDVSDVPGEQEPPSPQGQPLPRRPSDGPRKSAAPDDGVAPPPLLRPQRPARPLPRVPVRPRAEPDDDAGTDIAAGPPAPPRRPPAGPRPARGIVGALFRRPSRAAGTPPPQDPAATPPPASERSDPRLPPRALAGLARPSRDPRPPEETPPDPPRSPDAPPRQFRSLATPRPKSMRPGAEPPAPEERREPAFGARPSRPGNDRPGDRPGDRPDDGPDDGPDDRSGASANDGDGAPPIEGRREPRLDIGPSRPDRDPNKPGGDSWPDGTPPPDRDPDLSPRRRGPRDGEPGDDDGRD